MEIVLATRNRGKVREIKNLLGDMDVDIKSLHDFPDMVPIEETGKDYRENAKIKAETVASLTGKIAIADDSGLEVYALNGKPGKDSARFIDKDMAYEEKNKILLHMLEEVPLKERGARFCCVIAIKKPGADIFFCDGVCEGVITEKPRGDKGFGYDPVFLVPEYNQTFAEMDASLKNKISHRAKTLGKAKKALKSLMEK